MMKKRIMVLDTSIQVRKLISPNLKKELNKLKNRSTFFSPFFTLYEFKTNFIKSLIEFYNIVKISTSPGEAFGIWSNQFQSRKLKFIYIMVAHVLMSSGSITNDTQDCLAKIESTIKFLLAAFETDVTMTGSFGSDDLVRYKIDGADTYEGFIKKYKDRKSIIPLNKFWEANVNQLDLLIDPRSQLETKYRPMHGALKKIRADYSAANKHNTNKAVHDAVIAVDMHNKHTLLTLDNSFELLCPALSKKFIRLKIKNGLIL